MFLPENVIFRGLSFSLGHFGQQAPDSHVSQLQNGVSTSFLPPFIVDIQGWIFHLTCSHPELTEDHVLTSAYVRIFRTVTRNAVNKSVWRKKDCSWPPLNKYAMNIWLSSLKIRAHLSWRTGKHLHVLHVLRTYSTCSCPGQQDTTTYAALRSRKSTDNKSVSLFAFCPATLLVQCHQESQNSPMLVSCFSSGSESLFQTILRQ